MLGRDRACRQREVRSMENDVVSIDSSDLITDPRYDLRKEVAM